jgi:hypothetical protein
LRLPAADAGKDRQGLAWHGAVSPEKRMLGAFFIRFGILLGTVLERRSEMKYSSSIPN